MSRRHPSGVSMIEHLLFGLAGSPPYLDAEFQIPLPSFPHPGKVSTYLLPWSDPADPKTFRSLSSLVEQGREQRSQLPSECVN